MNKTLLGGLVTVVAIIALVGVYMVNNRDDSSSSSNANTPSMSQESMGSMGSMESSTSPNAMAKQDKNAVVETDKVTMQDFAFVPAKIKVKKGTTVTWTNQDSARHNVAPDSPTAEFKEGELIGKDGQYSFTFNTVGSFSYYCSPHPYMKASVEVIE